MPSTWIADSATPLLAVAVGQAAGHLSPLKISACRVLSPDLPQGGHVTMLQGGHMTLNVPIGHGHGRRPLTEHVACSHTCTSSKVWSTSTCSVEDELSK